MTAPSSPPGDILAFDVGAVRIGVARASTLVQLPEPLTTIPNDETVWEAIVGLCATYNAVTAVVGLPRGLDGQETTQTEVARVFADRLLAMVRIPVVLQDEAVTSRKAEEELAARGKPYVKGDIDALAATYILEDYLHAQRGKI